jgi:hypothetical protein
LEGFQNYAVASTDLHDFIGPSAQVPLKKIAEYKVSNLEPEIVFFYFKEKV